jgi:hypothetical protein
MKKLVIFFSVLYSGCFLAQDLTSKEGEPILPQAKDWSFGIDATYLIKNIGFGFTSNSQAIQVKYMKDAKTAFRIGARIGVNDWTSKAFVPDRVAATSSVVAYPAAAGLKQNTWKRTSTAVGLSFGLEKRRGVTRLQGIYGAEIGVYLSSSRDKFSYGNALNASPLGRIDVDRQADAMTSASIGNARNIDTVPMIQGVEGAARILERKNGISLSIGGRVFLGAEYFILPKMSLGGEFGWGIGFSSVGRSETTYESIGKGTLPSNSTASVNRTIIDGGTSSHTWLDTDNSNMLGGLSATLRLNIYF